MADKRTPIQARRGLKEAALERAKAALQYAKTPAARLAAMSEIRRLRRELGMK